MATDNVTGPDVRLLEMMRGYRAPQALYLAVQLGIAELLNDGPKSAEQLAEATGCHARSLCRMLRALSTSSVFVELPPGGVFGQSPMSDLLRRDHPATRRPSIQFLGAAYTQASWADLAYGIRTGESPFKHVHGVSKWQFNQAHPEEGAIFDQVMAGARPGRVNVVLESYDFSGLQGTLVDVGGGYGHLLAAILHKNPALKGVVFDLPSLMPEAQRRLAQAGLADRCQAIGGSFFEKLPPGDAYLLSDVIHDWPDNESLAILKACRAAMNPAARVLISEHVLVPCQTLAPVAWLDLQMLVEFGEGRQRTEEEIRGLARGAGLEVDRVIKTPDSLIFEARAVSAK